MPITLDEPQGPRIPVMKRQRIGDTVTGAVVRTVQRDEPHGIYGGLTSKERKLQ